MKRGNLNVVYCERMTRRPEDFQRYLQHRVVSASEACTILDCSRQNIDDLMRRDKLPPIRTDVKYNLFSKAEVMQRQRD